MWRFAGVSLMPNRTVHDLAEGSRICIEWRASAQEQGSLELVPFAGWHDRLRHALADYLFANLTVAGQRAVVAPDAVVRGEVVDSVVWSGCEVGPAERLVDRSGPATTSPSRSR